MICQKCNKNVIYGEKCYCQRYNEEKIKINLYIFLILKK